MFIGQPTKSYSDTRICELASIRKTEL